MPKDCRQRTTARDHACACVQIGDEDMPGKGLQSARAFNQMAMPRDTRLLHDYGLLSQGPAANRHLNAHAWEGLDACGLAHPVIEAGEAKERTSVVVLTR